MKNKNCLFYGLLNIISLLSFSFLLCDIYTSWDGASWSLEIKFILALLIYMGLVYGITLFKVFKYLFEGGEL